MEYDYGLENILEKGETAVNLYSLLFPHKFQKPSISSLLTLSKEALVLKCLQYSLLKTLWKKEKLLVTSNFSFSHSIFYLFKSKNFQLYSSNLKLLSANSFNLEESKMCHSEKGNKSPDSLVKVLNQHTQKSKSAFWYLRLQCLSFSH